MAAVQISGAVWPANAPSRVGPFKDSSGNLWVVLNDSNSHWHAYKSTNGGATWTSIAAGPNQANTAQDCVFDATNQVIYVVSVATSQVAQIWKFPLSTLTWARVDSGTGPTVNTDVNGVAQVFLALRSTGSFVVVYQGPTQTLMGKQYRRAYYSTCTSAGVWGTATEFDQWAGNALNVDLRAACLGASDRVHALFFSDNINTPVWHRSLDSTNTLDTAAQVTTGGGSANADTNLAVFYDATMAKLIVAVDTTVWNTTSAANPTFTSSNTLSTGVASAVAFAYTSGTLYGFYSDASQLNDGSSTAGTGAFTVATFEATTTASALSAGVTTGIGVVWNQTSGTAGVYFDTLTFGSPVSNTATLAFTASKKLAPAAALPYASSQTLHDPASAPVEVGQTLRVAAAAAPAELLKRLAQTGLLPSESTLTLKVTAGGPFASSQAIMAAAQDPFEAQHGVAASPVSQTAALAIETLQALRVAATAQLATSQQVSGTVLTRTETLLAIFNTAGAALEQLKAIATTAQERAEAVQSIRSMSPLPGESAAALARAAVTAFEAVADVAAAAGTRAEALQSATANRQLPAEVLHALASSAANPFESQGNLAVSQTAQLVLEALSAISSTGRGEAETTSPANATAAAPAELLRSITATSPAAAEALQKIRALAAAAFEAQGNAVVSQTAALAVEALRSLAALAQAETESTAPTGSTAAADAESQRPVAATALTSEESLQAITRTAAAPFEASGVVLNSISQTAGLVLEAIAPVQKPATFRTDSVQPVAAIAAARAEQLASLAAVDAAPLEQLAAVEAVGTFPLEQLAAVAATTDGDPVVDSVGAVSAASTVTFETGGLLFGVAALLLADAALTALRLGDTSDALRLADRAATAARLADATSGLRLSDEPAVTDDLGDSR